jgi:methyl-accepting chemotaxis protein
MHIMDMTNENSGPNKTRNVYPNKRVPAQMNPEQIAQSIKNIAKGIHEGSYQMRKTVRILHQGGAVNELTQAIYYATVAARDTAREIRDTARDLKEDGIVRGTASAIQQTTAAARVTVHTVRDMATETAETFPKAIMTELPEWP